MKICSAIINLFHLIPAAPQTLVKPLLEVVMKTERAMLIEVKVEINIADIFALQYFKMRCVFHIVKRLDTKKWFKNKEKCSPVLSGGVTVCCSLIREF